MVGLPVPNRMRACGSVGRPRQNQGMDEAYQDQLCPDSSYFIHFREDFDVQGQFSVHFMCQGGEAPPVEQERVKTTPLVEGSPKPQLPTPGLTADNVI